MARGAPSLVLALVALLLLGLLAFANALPNPFVWDEDFLIVHNTLLKTGDPRPLLTAPYFSMPWEREEATYQRYRPLILLTFWMDYHLWRLKPVGYHLTSLAIHLVNSGLLYALIRALTGRGGLALAVAALFLIHPMQPEAVAYIPSRGTLLAGAGLLLLIWLHRRWRSRGRLTAGEWLGELLAYSGALLSMETAIVAPVVLWCYERAYRDDRDGSARFAEPSLTRSLRLETIGLGAVFLGYLLVRARWCPLGEITWQMDGASRLQLFGQTMTTYLRWLLVPVDIRFPVMDDPQFPLWGGLLWLVVVMAGGGWLWLRARPPWAAVSFGLLWGLVTLLPVANLAASVSPPLSVHQLYLPAMGFGLALGALGARAVQPLLARRRGRALLLCGVGAVGVWWFQQTLALNAHWGSHEAVYQDSIAAGPPFSAIGHQMLTIYYLEAGRPEEALVQAQQVIQQEPARAHAYLNRGLCYQQLGRTDEAEASYRTALQLDPGYALAYNNLSILLLQRRAFEEAEALARQAIQAYPAFPEAYGNLGEALWYAGRREEALAAVERAMALQPDEPLFAISSGAKLLELGRAGEAAEAYRRALQVSPKLGLAQTGFAKAQGMLEQWPQALAAHERAVVLTPDDPEAHAAYGITLARLQRYAEAITQFERALALDPSRGDVQRDLERARARKRTQNSKVKTQKYK